MEKTSLLHIKGRDIVLNYSRTINDITNRSNQQLYVKNRSCTKSPCLSIFQSIKLKNSSRKSADILKPENRSWFILALSRLALLSGENPFLFKGELRKIRLVSNRLGYGPCPEPDEEVEQHITLNAEGQVWFSSYVFGQRRDG